ncbi:Maf family protein [Alicyclobacillus kakegawensis]|uniref:Maf family protein n=1 Tax=Alicyclobacillus kakegawensis TaxID=392012 RepID=UPI00082AB4FA|nr:Maf family protein [Alicyclobacillus kakegawensis]
MAVMNQARLVLASSSPRRRQLLAMFQRPFEVQTSETDESVPGRPHPAELVQTLAARKAGAVLQRLGGRDTLGDPVIVIGADTVVSLDGEILGKPRGHEQAFVMLSRLQGRTHDVYTGLCVLARDTHGAIQQRQGFSRTRVHMSSLNPQQIHAYIATGEPLDKAGAYGIQGYGSILIHRIEGDYFTVVGLPLHLLGRYLEELGCPLLDPQNRPAE